MKILVTGAAGFIGSHLVEKLSDLGHQVTALDCLLGDSYDPKIKFRNFENLKSLPNVKTINFDLRNDIPDELLTGIEVLVNEAAMPGLMKSWNDFRVYSDCNLLAVQNLALASVRNGNIPILQISTSSVYGSHVLESEKSPLNPVSPYGVSKLAAENLLSAFNDSFGLPFTILRYFSVYGPRQRPDMAYNIISKAIINEEVFDIFGDGNQIRTNTYVDDIVNGTILAILASHTCEVYNLAGEEKISLNDAVKILEKIIGKQARIQYREARPGDQKTTTTSTKKARDILGYKPVISLEEGLEMQARWQMNEIGMQFGN
jgi:nucleoside-diphosphate-sugar epimerase